MTSGSETSRTTTSRACLEDAADAAVRAKSRLVGSDELLRIGSIGRYYGSSTVQAALLDVAGDALGHQVLDGGAAGHPGADVAGGDGEGGDLHAVDPAGGAGHLLDHVVDVEVRPGGGDELRELEHLLGLLPGEELLQQVGTADEQQAGPLGQLAAEPAQGVDRVGGPGGVDLQ